MLRDNFFFLIVRSAENFYAIELNRILIGPGGRVRSGLEASMHAEVSFEV